LKAEAKEFSLVEVRCEREKGRVKDYSQVFKITKE
jgi:hypothetical protein